MCGEVISVDADLDSDWLMIRGLVRVSTSLRRCACKPSYRSNLSARTNTKLDVYDICKPDPFMLQEPLASRPVFLFSQLLGSVFLIVG